MARADDKANELVTLTTTASVLDAELLCTTLRAAGIKAFVPNENSSTMLPHMIGAINPDGVPVVVRASDVQAARAVLAGKQDAPPAGNRRGASGPDRPGGRKDDRFAPPDGAEDDPLEVDDQDEDWDDGEDLDPDDVAYDEEEEDQDDEDGTFDEDGRGGDEYDADDVDAGRESRWDGSPASRDRDGRQRDGGQRRTLKFEDHEQKGDRDDRTDGADRADRAGRAGDWSEEDDESDDFSDFEAYEDEHEEGPSPTAADRYAAAAARSILFTFWLPPAAIWTLYCICQAMQARVDEPPSRPEQFQSNLWCAVLAGLGSAVLASIIYYHILVNW